MLLPNYDLVILGNEPGGIWLAETFLRTFSQIPQGKGPRKAVPATGPNVLWIRLGEEPVPQFSVAPGIAAELGLRLDCSNSVELITPNRVFDWNEGFIKEHFALSPLAKSFFPSARESLGIQYALTERPSVLGFARALWKWTGRGDELTPEKLLTHAQSYLSYGFWNPLESLPETVQRLSIAQPRGALEKIDTKGKGLTLHFQGIGAVHSARWVLNETWGNLKRLSETEPGLLELLYQDDDILGPTALYPLEVVAETIGLNDSLKPLTLLVDSEEIPDPTTEVWPLQSSRSVNSKHTKLTLWAEARREASLKDILACFRNGMKRLNRLFPFLPTHVLSVTPSLGLETCHDESIGKTWLNYLDEHCRERYRLSTPHAMTRHPGLFHLGASVGSHLPYPMGTCLTGKALLREWLGKYAAEKKIFPPPTPGPNDIQRLQQ